MAGQRQKPPSMLANTRGGRGRGLTVIVPSERKVPRMPPPPAGVRWGVEPRRIWREFWRSDVSAAVRVEADGEALRHWMEAVHDREALMDQVRAAGWKVPTGDTWVDVQPDGTEVVVRRMVPHPALQHVKHLDREIAKLREHFGMTPLSRFRLQFTFAEAGQSEIRLRRAQRTAPVSDAPEEVIDLDAMG